MADNFVIKRAEKTQQKIKAGLQGPSGSGKTKAAIFLALALAKASKTGNQRVCLVDTENESASLYADLADFDTLPLSPPYTSKRIIAALKAVVAADYSAAVLDTMSHQWIDLLARKEAVDARGGNQFSNWAPFTKEHEEFKAEILNLPIHFIATLRSKSKWLLEENARGKQAPKKVGMEAVQREGMEYELTLNFELGMDHLATVTKDRTGIFDGRQPFPLIDADRNESLIAPEIIAWLSSGRELKPVAKPEPAAEDRASTLEEVHVLVTLMQHEAISAEARAKIQAALDRGEPPMSRVNKWTEQLRAKITESGAALPEPFAAPAKAGSGEDAAKVAA